MKSDNPFQLTFTLRQHTPIIHFQWNEEGATIRPTELKAKLDKWLIASIMNEHRGGKERLDASLQDETLKKWLKGAKVKDKTNPALNYTVKVVAVGSNSFKDELNTRVVTKQKPDNRHPDKTINVDVVEDKDYPNYFGNQLKPEDWTSGKKRIKRLSYFNGVIVTISSPYVDLITEIRNRFAHFLLKTNFGTRQGKGFGSFFIEKDTVGFPENYKDWITKKFDWMFDVEVSGNTERKKVEDLFSKIDLFYKTLRSGISPHDKQLYFKSMMWKYAQSLTRQWDKKTLKQEFVTASETTQKSIHPIPFNAKNYDFPIHWENGKKIKVAKPNEKSNYPNETHLLWRDILGLSSDQAWHNYRLSFTRKHWKETLPDSHPEKKNVFSRFQSPIFFKPIRTGENTFRVFFEVPSVIKAAFKSVEERATSLEAQILGEWFEIQKTGSSNFIPLPYPENFDFDRFLAESFITDIDQWIIDGTYEKRVKDKTFAEPHGRTRKVRIGKHFEEIDNSDFFTIMDIYNQLKHQADFKIKKLKEQNQ